jgi:hypothetical protein
MIWFLLVLVAIAALAPLIGADTRDGRDWQPTDSDPYDLRTSDSRVAPSGARAPVAARRTAPAAG